MAFHNVRIPDDFAYGSVFGHGFATVTQTTSTGHEFRIARQAQARHRYTPLSPLKSQTDAAALKAFALARRNALHGFRLKDWFDYTSSEIGTDIPTLADQALGVGDGSRTQFQLVKTYDESGADPYVRPITLPVAGSVVVAVDGVSASFSVTNPGGLVTLSSAPSNGAVVTAGFEFDVPVRFESSVDEMLRLRADGFGAWTPDQLACIEVLDEIAWPELWNPGGATAHGTVSQSFAISYAEGELHTISPSSSISVFLPVPRVGGPRHFVIANLSGSNTIQVRDDAGNAVGSAIAALTTKRVGCVVSGSTATWMIY